MQDGFAVGDLVCVANLPRNTGGQVWQPDPAGPFLGLVVEVKHPTSGSWSLVGECVVIELDTGELTTLSANMVELIDHHGPWVPTYPQ
jgi:hypothetical protein